MVGRSAADLYRPSLLWYICAVPTDRRLAPPPAPCRPDFYLRRRSMVLVAMRIVRTTLRECAGMAAGMVARKLPCWPCLPTTAHGATPPDLHNYCSMPARHPACLQN